MLETKHLNWAKGRMQWEGCLHLGSPGVMIPEHYPVWPLPKQKNDFQWLNEVVLQSQHLQWSLLKSLVFLYFYNNTRNIEKMEPISIES